MQRLSAIGRCLFYGFLPPSVEYLWRGYVHYAPAGLSLWSWGMTWRYGRHWWGNMTSACTLAIFLPLSEEDREFHKLATRS